MTFKMFSFFFFCVRVLICSGPKMCTSSIFHSVLPIISAVEQNYILIVEHTVMRISTGLFANCTDCQLTCVHISPCAGSTEENGI